MTERLLYEPAVTDELRARLPRLRLIAYHAPDTHELVVRATNNNGVYWASNSPEVVRLPVRDWQTTMEACIALIALLAPSGHYVDS